MMTTPICDFVRRYTGESPLRLHMPGHKGAALLGPENGDITEIPGADSLYEAAGIIAESEQNAGTLFGARTFYSTEGSSLCIRAMLYLICLHARQNGRKPVIAAGRNVHKSFVSAAALLDIEVQWLYPSQTESYLSCPLDASALEAALREAKELPAAVYLTSPDYPGNTVDIRGIAAVCRQYGVLLAVDNAHGAYLKFLPGSRHPMDLGADICCDSAHKTLPVLTGGAYLHISRSAPALFAEKAKEALALFGSTSPSYLILQSLDRANRYISEGYGERLAAFIGEGQRLKEALRSHGYAVGETEPLKLTLMPKAYGYTGTALAGSLQQQGIVCEFADPDITVMMLAPETGTDGLARLKKVLLSLPRQTAVTQKAPAFTVPERVMSMREALFSVSETVPAAHSIGRVLAAVTVGCPPAVPVVVSGERISPAAAACFAYYGIDTCTVVR